jgi:uncharacterized membrane protein YbhN (UPF0104 family)
VQLAERAQPWWIGAGTALQVGTYVAQGWIWRLVGAAADYRLSWTAALELAFAKLFTDQALPSAGLSSGILIAKGLERRRLPSTAVNASVLVNVASYHLAYVTALLGALVMLQRRGDANALVMVTAVLFLLFSLGLSVAVLVLSDIVTAGPPASCRRSRDSRRYWTSCPLRTCGWSAVRNSFPERSGFKARSCFSMRRRSGCSFGR